MNGLSKHVYRKTSTWTNDTFIPLIGLPLAAEILFPINPIFD